MIRYYSHYNILHTIDFRFIITVVLVLVREYVSAYLTKIAAADQSTVDTHTPAPARCSKNIIYGILCQHLYLWLGGWAGHAL